LRIRRELLDEFLFPFHADTACCSSVEIDLPVVSSDSTPLRVTIGQMIINLSCSSPAARPTTTFLEALSARNSGEKLDRKDSVDKDKGATFEMGSWGKTFRMLLGMLVEIDLVDIRLLIGGLPLRVCLRDIVLQSTSPDWSPVSRFGFLDRCFDETSTLGEVKIFKVLQINSLQLQILSLEQLQSNTILDFAFNVKITVSLIKDTLRPSEVALEAVVSRCSISLNNHQIERMYLAAFGAGRVYRSASMMHPAHPDLPASDLASEGKKQVNNSRTADQRSSVLLPMMRVHFSLCKTEIVIGSRCIVLIYSIVLAIIPATCTSYATSLTHSAALLPPLRYRLRRSNHNRRYLWWSRNFQTAAPSRATPPAISSAAATSSRAGACARFPPCSSRQHVAGSAGL
jgi:hypothetical protein